MASLGGGLRMVTVRECWEVYRREHLPLTATPYKTEKRWSNLSWFDGKDAEFITPADVRDYQASRKVSAGTINRDLTVLNAVLRYAWKIGMIQRTPFIAKLPAPPPKLRYLTKSEVAKVMDAIVSMDWRTQTYIKIALATGARTGAILDLTWDRIKDNTADFRATDSHARRRKGRTVVPVNTMMAEALKLARQHANGPYVMNVDGRRMSSVQRMFRRLAKETKIKDLTAHVLRHTVASLLLQNGGDLLEVSRLLAHKNSKTTEQIYFAHTTSYLKGVTDKLNSLGRTKK